MDKDLKEILNRFPDFVGFVSDINLKEILSDSLIKELDTAVNKYAVLIFKDQNITDDEQVRFTEYFLNL